LQGSIERKAKGIKVAAHFVRVDLAKDLVYYRSMEVNIHEAKTHLSRLLERVAMGEEVIIAKAGTPVAKLVPIKQTNRGFKFGSAKGKMVIADDFNDPLPKEIEDLFW
jgi:prevent-host-death family protein